MSNSTLWTESEPRRSALLLALLVGVVYAASLRTGFHYDDFHSIVNNPHLTTANLGAFFVDPSLFSVNPASAMYRPLLLASLTLNRVISGQAPWSYHLLNVLLHAASAIAVCRLVRSMSLPPAVAMAAAALFAVHPINSEAVTYTSSRSELLAALGILLFCCLALSPAPRRWKGIAAVGSLMAALLSKSVAVVGPILLWLSTGRRDMVDPPRRRRLVWILGACVGMLAVYLSSIRSLLSHAVLDEPVRTMGVQLATQLKALCYYLWLTAMPVHLSVEHQFSTARDFGFVVGCAGAFVGSLLCLCWRSRHPWRWGSAWWLVCLLPTLIVPLIVLVNEHRLYTASVGVFVLIAFVFHGGSSPGSRVAVGWIAVYTILLAVLTTQRVDVWHSERTLWADAVVKAPASLKAHLRWADALQKEGELAAAEAAYLQAVHLRAHHPGARNNLGRLYLLQGRWDEARRQFEELLSVSPDNIPARMNLGQIHFRQQRLGQARDEYLTALTYDNTQGRAQLRIAQIGLRQNAAADEILDWLDQAQLAGERSADVHVSRGIVLRRLGRTKQALEAYQQAVRVDSTSVDGWFNLGNLFVELQEYEKAAAAYGKAAAQSRPEEPIHQAALTRLEAVKETINPGHPSP